MAKDRTPGRKIKGITFYLYAKYSSREKAMRAGNRLMKSKNWLYSIYKMRDGYGLYVA